MYEHFFFSLFRHKTLKGLFHSTALMRPQFQNWFLDIPGPDNWVKRIDLSHMFARFAKHFCDTLFISKFWDFFFVTELMHFST
jgi:hypothetical protein